MLKSNWLTFLSISLTLVGPGRGPVSSPIEIGSMVQVVCNLRLKGSVDNYLVEWELADREIEVPSEIDLETAFEELFDRFKYADLPPPLAG